MLGAAPSLFQQLGVQPRQPRMDLLQRFQFVAAERRNPSRTSQVGGQLFGELEQRPTVSATGQRGLVVDAQAALLEGLFVLLDQ